MIFFPAQIVYADGIDEPSEPALIEVTVSLSPDTGGTDSPVVDTVVDNQDPSDIPELIIENRRTSM